MDSGLSISVYFGLSFSIAIFIYNSVEFYLAGRQGIQTISVTTLMEVGFRFFRFKKNGVLFTLGWLPVGSILKNDAQNGPEELAEPETKAKLRKIKSGLALSMLAGLLLCILLIDFGLNGFNVMATFLSDYGQLVLGTIDFKQFFELFVKLNPNHPIFFSLSLIILLLLISEFFTLMIDSRLKYLGYIIMLAFMCWYVVFFYKLLIHIDLKALAGFYFSCLVSSALLLFISSLIITKK